MFQPDLVTSSNQQLIGLAHFAISAGSKQKVDELALELSNEGYELLDGPRWIGDGYYESVISDPDKNRVEITI